MRIVMISAEVSPWVRAGGLAEDIRQLATALDQRGLNVTVIAPYCPELSEPGVLDEIPIPLNLELTVPVGSKTVRGKVWGTRIPKTKVEVILLDQPGYFRRVGLYQEAGKDYRDNCERFVFFCRASLQAIQELQLSPDIIHGHDWPAGLVPALLKIEHTHSAGLDQTRSVLTVHHAAYQGQFLDWDMELTGLDWRYFNWRQMEFFGKLNLLKTGAVFVDKLTTVSPTYAMEIQQPNAGHGLHGVFRSRSRDLTGIVNGRDHQRWNPESDPSLPRQFGLEDFAIGKDAAKAELQAQLGLERNPSRPVLLCPLNRGLNSGWELLLGNLKHLLQERMQLVLWPQTVPLDERLAALANESPESIACVSPEEEGCAGLWMAAADLSLHISAEEPCPARQLMCLAYGAVPVSYKTGGLADTLVDATPVSLQMQTASGFHFTNYTPEAMREALLRALQLWKNPPEWDPLVRAGMHDDWTWHHTADQYLEVYQRALASRESSLVSVRQPL